MKALRVQKGKTGIFEVARPSAEGEALVRVIASGICNTDLEIVKGYAGFNGTLGHEFVGVIERADVAPEMVSTRVVGEINAGCGECYNCSLGDPRHCPRRTVLGILGRDGAHAEFLSLPLQNLAAVPDVIGDEEAVFAEPLAAAWGITEQVDLSTETKIAVIGDGKFGLLCALTLARVTDGLTLIGRHPEKLKIAGDIGVHTRLTNDLSGLDRSFDVVVEASGSESGFESAVGLVRPRGKIVLKSTFNGRPTWPASRIVVDEITVVGSRCGKFGPALELLETRAVDVRPLISDVLSLSEGVKAMERAAERGILKVLLRMDG